MRVTELQSRYDYGYWANARLFEVIRRLSQEEFTRPVAGSYGSIRTALVHVLSAEWGWLGRCGGFPRGARLKPEDFPTAQSVIDAWATVESHLRQFLSKLTDADLERDAEYLNHEGQKRSMPVGELLHHAANHGVHHRGQIALLLRMLGYTPGDHDLLNYYAERRGVLAF